MKNYPNKNNPASIVGNSEWPAVSDPVVLLEEKKPEIIMHMRRVAGYTEVYANSIFLSLVEILKKLKPMRFNKPMTYEFIEKTVKPLSFGEKYFVLCFLLKATDKVFTFSYAFDGAARILNIYFHAPVAYKYPPEYKLMEAIQEDTDLRSA